MGLALLHRSTAPPQLPIHVGTPLARQIHCSLMQDEMAVLHHVSQSPQCSLSVFVSLQTLIYLSSVSDQTGHENCSRPWRMLSPTVYCREEGWDP